MVGAGSPLTPLLCVGLAVVQAVAKQTSERESLHRQITKMETELAAEAKALAKEGKAKKAADATNKTDSGAYVAGGHDGVRAFVVDDVVVTAGAAGAVQLRFMDWASKAVRYQFIRPSVSLSSVLMFHCGCCSHS